MSVFLPITSFENVYHLTKISGILGAKSNETEFFQEENFEFLGTPRELSSKLEISERIIVRSTCMHALNQKMPSH